MIERIYTYPPEEPIKIEDFGERFYMLMWEAYEKGISPVEFRKIRISDLNVLQELSEAMTDRQNRKMKNEELRQKLKGL